MILKRLTSHSVPIQLSFCEPSFSQFANPFWWVQCFIDLLYTIDRRCPFDRILPMVASANTLGRKPTLVKRGSPAL